MTILLPALAVAFGAFCVWLTVRILNRRERWAKWTAVGLILVVAYPLGTGPVQWLNWNTPPVPYFAEAARTVYAPIRWLGGKSPAVGRTLDWYVGLWVDWNDAPGLNLPPGVRLPSSWERFTWE
jgi:hypothetical protein